MLRDKEGSVIVMTKQRKAKRKKVVLMKLLIILAGCTGENKAPGISN